MAASFKARSIVSRFMGKVSNWSISFWAEGASGVAPPWISRLDQEVYMLYILAGVSYTYRVVVSINFLLYIAHLNLALGSELLMTKLLMKK